MCFQKSADALPPKCLSLCPRLAILDFLKPVTGFGPVLPPWQGGVLSTGHHTDRERAGRPGSVYQAFLLAEGHKTPLHLPHGAPAMIWKPATGLEPVLSAWKADVLSVEHYTDRAVREVPVSPTIIWFFHLWRKT